MLRYVVSGPVANLFEVTAACIAALYYAINFVRNVLHEALAQARSASRGSAITLLHNILGDLQALHQPLRLPDT